MMTSSPRLYPSLILLACLGAMATALTTQYGFGLKPCILCLFQRIPYVLSGTLAAIALIRTVPPKTRLILVGICGVAFAINSGIAFYHVGVEQHWWVSACTGGPGGADSVDALKAALAGPPPVPCDQIPWEVFGISMAGYNILFSLFLAAFAGWSVLRMKEAA